MTREEIKKSLRDNLNFLKKRNPNDGYTCITRLGRNGDNIWAIVMAWDDFDGTGKEAICAKVAYQYKRSLMQEYGWDWNMPYDEKTGEVNDTEITNVKESDFDWLIDQWEMIKAELKKE